MLRSFLVLICICLSQLCSQLHAQEEVIIGGNKFLIHTVEKGNTLYAISRTYSLPVSDILLANPEASNGLKIGQELKIPVNSIDKKEAKTSPELKNNFLIHKAEKKETLYAISKKYGVSVKTLYDNNPGLKSSGLKVGAEVKIPTNASEDADAKSLNPPREIGKRYHTVKRKETLYGLSKKYNVTVSNLKDANGGLTAGLKVGQEIIIPAGVKPATTNTVQEEIFSVDNTAPVRSILDSDSEISSGELVTVALMLPFNLNTLDFDKKLGHNQVALEFYQGAKLALDSLKGLGLRAKVYVYDTEKNPAKVRQILARSEINDVNLFIGPLYKKCFLEVARFSTERGIPLISPVPQSNKILLNNPSVSKVYCSDASQARWLGAITRKKYTGSNVLVLSENSDEEKRLSKFFESAAMFGTQDSLRQVIFWDKKFNVDKVKVNLDANRDNIIYIPSGNVSFVMNAITNLTPLTKDYNIRLMGTENWIKADQIETSDLVKLKVTLPVSTYTNYEAENVKQLLKQYRALYNTDPNEFALLGFDVLYYYMLGYLKYGSSFSVDYNDVVFEPTAVRFRMKRVADGSGFENTGVYVLEYDDNFQLNPIY